jgi:hypothetical protein
MYLVNGTEYDRRLGGDDTRLTNEGCNFERQTPQRLVPSDAQGNDQHALHFYTSRC